MISRDLCQRVLQKAAATGADYAELFAEHTNNHNINMIASKVDAIRDSVVAGAAVRLYKGLRSVMATTRTPVKPVFCAARKRLPRPWGRVLPPWTSF